MAQAVQRLKIIQARISEAERKHGGGEGQVTLVAVSKTFSIEDIRPVIAAGARVFGENRVQEAQSKWPALKREFPDIELHLLGPLQSNKAGEAVALFDVIETVDREKIAAAIARESQRLGRIPRLYVQVNIGEEPQKAGIVPGEAVAFVARCRSVHRLAIEGLMCIPPAGADPEPFFRHLADLARASGVNEVSMGMSGDFEIAIFNGASSVRVGSAIFGKRPAKV